MATSKKRGTTEQAAQATLTAAHSAGLLDPQLDASLAAVVLETARGVDTADATGGKRAYSASVHLKALDSAGLLPGSPARRTLENWLADQDEDDVLRAV